MGTVAISGILPPLFLALTFELRPRPVKAVGLQRIVRCGTRDLLCGAGGAARSKHQHAQGNARCSSQRPYRGPHQVEAPAQHCGPGGGRRAKIFSTRYEFWWNTFREKVSGITRNRADGVTKVCFGWIWTTASGRFPPFPASRPDAPRATPCRMAGARCPPLWIAHACSSGWTF